MNFAGFLQLFGGYLYVGILHPTACFNLSTKPGPWGYQRRLFHNWGSFQGLVPGMKHGWNIPSKPSSPSPWKKTCVTQVLGPLLEAITVKCIQFLDHRYRFRSYARMNIHNYAYICIYMHIYHVCQYVMDGWTDR